MSIPIDYNKMQNILDRRRYMGHVYTGKVETWQPTELGLKTYGNGVILWAGKISVEKSGLAQMNS